MNGPYALITTAVSAELGTHESLHGNAKALATVTAIIDGTGSIGKLIRKFVKDCVINKQIFYYFNNFRCCCWATLGWVNISIRME